MNCSFAVSSPEIVCGCDGVNTQIVTLSECSTDISAHMQVIKQFKGSPEVKSETNLIIARAGLFAKWNDDNKFMTICPQHRFQLGLGFRPNWRGYCELKLCHDTQVKATRTLNVKNIMGAYKQYDKLYPLGSYVCDNCRKQITVKATFNDFKQSTSNNSSDSEKESESSSEVSGEESSTGTPEAQDQPAEKEPGFLSPKSDHTYVYSHGTSGTEYSLSQETNKGDNTKRELLDRFLLANGKEPIQKVLRTEWDEACDRTKQDYSKKAQEIFICTLKVLAPDHYIDLGQAVVQSKELIEELEMEEDLDDNELLEAFGNAYGNAKTWTSKRQILSIIANKFPYSDVKGVIPQITKFKYYVARLHASLYGEGSEVETNKKYGTRVKNEMIDSFLEYLVSPQVCVDVPYGEKKMKLSSGFEIAVPRVILTSCKEWVVQEYIDYCKANHIEHASARTYRKILDAVGPAIRKSVAGLDYFTAEGTKSFDELNSICDRLASCGVDMSSKADKLNAYRNYLKLEYKLHVQLKSNVADHCMTHALSDSADSNLAESCGHEHNAQCPNCEQGYQVLTEMGQIIMDNKEELGDDFDETLYVYQQAKTSIFIWKMHQLRNVNQNRARKDAIDALDDKTMLLEMDWAMKLLPQRFRESQQHFFGKVGISCHISVFYTKPDGENLLTFYLTHLFTKCVQDSHTVLCILQHNMEFIEENHPSIKELKLRSDNAGCYKSNETITGIKKLQSAQLKITNYDFCDSQGGKGACDRKAAHLKAHLKRYVNQGSDAIDAFGIKKGLESNKGVNAKIFVCEEPVESSTANRQDVIPGISSYFNFTFNEDGKIKAKKAYQIGTGNDFACTGKAVDVLLIHETPTLELNELPDRDIASENSSGFHCPEEGCMFTCRKPEALEKHLDIGNHNIVSLPSVDEKLTLTDKSKVIFRDVIDRSQRAIFTKPSAVVTVDNEQMTESSECKEKGWALKHATKRSRFNDNQKSWLEEIFEEGNKKGDRHDPEKIAQRMRKVMRNGERRFGLSEFLKPSQIQNYFSRLLKTNKKTLSSSDLDDLSSIDRELEMQNLNQLAMNVEFNVNHPIIIDDINLCDTNLKSLSLRILKQCACDLSLKPRGNKRKKDTFIEAINVVIDNCSCRK